MPAGQGADPSKPNEPTPPSNPQRRTFFKDLGKVAAATSLAGGLSIAPSIAGLGEEALAAGSTSVTGKKRRAHAVKLRKKIASKNLTIPVGNLEGNGDEELYPDRIANYTKGMPHDENGIVDPAAYDLFLKAVKTGKPEDWEAIPQGWLFPSERRRFVNPQCGIAFDLEGRDACQYEIPAAPKFASAEVAGEAVELYWMAALRDVAFNDYATDVNVAAAAAELTSMTDFRGPKAAGVVTPGLLFRDDAVGCDAGPYISQFLLKSVPFGAVFIEQKMRTPVAADDFLVSFSQWLNVQRGFRPENPSQTFDPTRRYIRNGRDLAQWVHIDVLYQAYFHAALILLTPSNPADQPTGGGIGCPMNATNPYFNSVNQEGFGTFGPPFVMTMLTEVATRALKAVWFSKWFVNRRLRPEMFAGRVHQNLALAFDHPIHADVLDSDAVANTFSLYGSYLLPQAFPEGSPLHPSYGAGHATVAGACVTILKALFKGDFPMANPKVPAPDGLTLVDYVGGDAGSLTVEGELNKLASNIALGRNIAGVHWRSDAYWSMRLGEQVAIAVLKDQKRTFNEEFDGFSFTSFDGETITI